MQKIDAQVEESRCQIASKDLELAQQNQSLKLAELKKKNTAQGFSDIRQNISSSEKRVKQLLSQKENLEKQLEIKEKEKLLFIDSHSKQQELLKEVMSIKEKEIASLKKQLEELTTELEEANAQIGEYEAELRKIKADMSRKSKEVKSLQDSNAQNKQELDLKRKEVDRLRMQQTAAEESNDKYRKQTMVRTVLASHYCKACIHYYCSPNNRVRLTI